MCGREYAAEITKRFPHEVTCPVCGELFEIPGNPEVPLSEFTRPFWADQFCKYRHETQPDEAAGLHPLMLIVVGRFCC